MTKNLRPILSKVKVNNEIPESLAVNVPIRIKIYEAIRDNPKITKPKLRLMFPKGDVRNMERQLIKLQDNKLIKTTKCDCYENCQLRFYEVVKDVRT